LASSAAWRDAAAKANAARAGSFMGRGWYLN
jgi:hypothetical protein